MYTPFVYNPQRDAWKAIRGFYYQVEVTIIRWLELQADTVMYCEYGEDIDHVKQLLDIDEAIPTRLLEQIKTRDKITLTRHEALTALARFHDAGVTNPSLHILYRFSTTATPGREQGIQFPRNLPGNAAWNSIREGAFDANEVQKFVAALKHIVASASCPKDLPAEIFLQFQNYVASAEPIALTDDLIRRYEWATDLPNPPRLREEIESRLLNQSRAYRQEEAKHLTDVLIVHVLELLTKKGEKRLTVGELERLLSERSITEVDRRILTRLLSFVEQAAEYLPQLASHIESISQNTARLPNIEDMQKSLIQQVSGIQAQLVHVPLPPPDDPPIRPLAFAKRTDLVFTLYRKLSETTWLNITGAAGLGKTYIARLLAEMHGLDRVIWISLRGEQTTQSLLNYLDRHLLRIASYPDCPDLVQAYAIGALSFSQLSRLVADRLTAEGVIVTDELPDLLKIPRVGEKLVDLTLALQESGGKLLTTAQRNVPPSVTQHLYDADSAFIESPIPPMTQQDIDEMLTATGAPPAFHGSDNLNLIQSATHGHPALVAATISFLRRNNWTIDEPMLILKGDPLEEIRAETRRKVFHLLRDENLCALLYRLSLATTSFDRDLVRVVARVHPPIQRPTELFAELTGPWVYNLGSDRFEVSPLLSNAGQNMLDTALQRKIHLSIVSHYFRSRTINSPQVFQIITHLIAANDSQGLTAFLLQIASHLNERSHARVFEPIMMMFTSWPQDAPLALRIAIRTVQIRILTLLGNDAKSYIAELETMVRQINAFDLPTAMLALLLIGPFNPAADPVMAARKTLQARRLYSRLSSGEQLLPSDISLESLMWARLADIQTRDDIRGILAVLADMTEAERRAAFSFDLYDVRQLFTDDCWLIECLKSEDEQDWEGVLSLIAEMLRIAGLPGGEPLLAPTMRARAIVLADYMDRPQEALAVLEATPPPTDNNARFLLHYTAACILLEYSTPEASLERFQQALSEGPNAYSFLQFDALRRAAETAGRIGRWELMRAFAISSLQLSKEVHIVHEQLEMMGELAWAYWSLGDRLKACSAMSGLVRGLLRNRDFDKRRFREVFGKAGHTLGWMSSMADLGRSPKQTPDGHPYTTPFPGFFSRSRPQMADYNFPRRFDLLLTQLGWLSTGCRLYKFASRTFCEAKHLAQPQDLLSLQHLIDLELAELAAREERYREAFPLAISGIRTISLSTDQRQ